ncbi:hypothetical protein B0T11DRAFT_99607 [Plectosphaerella cucumerina]|uniref:Uncharacterized protein n=1 Tax=Plectosphaerella cucumerina TaxID=40658 RepID=A0A8K0X250_9PEZI|nr:hypothetical protein B0T11DRAFT_99607 [Plectosphaerella cucumerina]
MELTIYREPIPPRPALRIEAGRSHMLFDDPGRPANGVRNGKEQASRRRYFWILNLPRYRQRGPPFPADDACATGRRHYRHRPYQPTNLLSDTMAIGRQALRFPGVCCGQNPGLTRHSVRTRDGRYSTPSLGQGSREGSSSDDGTGKEETRRGPRTALSSLFLCARPSEACHSGPGRQKISRGRPASHIAISVVDMCVCIYLALLGSGQPIVCHQTPIHVISSNLLLRWATRLDKSCGIVPCSMFRVCGCCPAITVGGCLKSDPDWADICSLAQRRHARR